MEAKKNEKRKIEVRDDLKSPSRARLLQEVRCRDVGKQIDRNERARIM